MIDVALAGIIGLAVGVMSTLATLLFLCEHRKVVIVRPVACPATTKTTTEDWSHEYSNEEAE